MVNCYRLKVNMDWINVNKKPEPTNQNIAEKSAEVIVIDDDDDDDNGRVVEPGPHQSLSDEKNLKNEDSTVFRKNVNEIIFIDDDDCDIKTEPLLDNSEAIPDIVNNVKQEVFDSPQIKTEFVVECKIEPEEHQLLVDDNSNLLHLKKEIKEDKIEAINHDKAPLPPAHQSEKSAVNDVSSSTMNLPSGNAVTESVGNTDVNVTPNITHQLPVLKDSLNSLNESTKESTKDLRANQGAASSDNSFMSDQVAPSGFGASTSDLASAFSTAASNPWKHLSRIVPFFSKRRNCVVWKALNFEALRKMRPPNAPNNKPCRINLKGPHGKKVSVTIPADPPDYTNAVNNIVLEDISDINSEQAGKFKKGKHGFLMRDSKGKSKYIVTSKDSSQCNNSAKKRQYQEDRGSTDSSSSAKEGEGLKKSANPKRKRFKEYQPSTSTVLNGSIQSTSNLVPTVSVEEVPKSTIHDPQKMEEQQKPSTSSSIANGQNPQPNLPPSETKDLKKLPPQVSVPPMGTTSLKDFPNAKISLLEKRCRSTTSVVVESPQLLSISSTSVQQQSNGVKNSTSKLFGPLENVASTSEQEVAQSKAIPKNKHNLLPPLENFQEFFGIVLPKEPLQGSTSKKPMKCQQKGVNQLRATVISIAPPSVPVLPTSASDLKERRSSGNNDPRAILKQNSTEMTVQKVPAKQTSNVTAQNNNLKGSADAQQSLINSVKNNREDVNNKKNGSIVDHDYSKLSTKLPSLPASQKPAEATLGRSLVETNVASVANQPPFQEENRSKGRRRSSEDCLQRGSKIHSKVVTTSFLNLPPKSSTVSTTKQQIHSNRTHNVPLLTVSPAILNRNQPAVQEENKTKHSVLPLNNSTPSSSSSSGLQKSVETMAEKPSSDGDQGQGKIKPLHRRHSDGSIQQMKNFSLKSPPRRPCDKTEPKNQQTDKKSDTTFSFHIEKQLLSMKDILSELQETFPKDTTSGRKMEELVNIISQTYERLKDQEMSKSEIKTPEVGLVQNVNEISKVKGPELFNNGSVRNSSEVEGDKPTVEFKTPQGFPVKRSRIAHSSKNTVKNNGLPSKNLQKSSCISDRRTTTIAEEPSTSAISTQKFPVFSITLVDDSLMIQPEGPPHKSLQKNSRVLPLPRNQNQQVKVYPLQRGKPPLNKVPPQQKVPASSRTSPNQNFSPPHDLPKKVPPQQKVSANPNQKLSSSHGPSNNLSSLKKEPANPRTNPNQNFSPSHGLPNKVSLQQKVPANSRASPNQNFSPPHGLPNKVPPQQKVSANSNQKLSSHHGLPNNIPPQQKVPADPRSSPDQNFSPPHGLSKKLLFQQKVFANSNQKLSSHHGLPKNIPPQQKVPADPRTSPNQNFSPPHGFPNKVPPQQEVSADPPRTSLNQKLVSLHGFPNNVPPQQKVPANPRNSPNQNFPSPHGSPRVDEGQGNHLQEHAKKRTLHSQVNPQVPNKRPRLEGDKRRNNLYLNNRKVPVQKPVSLLPLPTVPPSQPKPVKKIPPYSNLQNGVKKPFHQAKSVDFSDINSTMSVFSQQSSVQPKPDRNLTKLPEYTSDLKTTKWLNVHFSKDKQKKKKAAAKERLNHEKHRIQQGHKGQGKSPSHSPKSPQIGSPNQSVANNPPPQQSTVRKSPPQSNVGSNKAKRSQSNASENLTTQIAAVGNNGRQNAIEQFLNGPASALFGSQNREMPSYSSLLKAVHVLSSACLLQYQQLPIVEQQKNNEPRKTEFTHSVNNKPEC